MVSALCVFGFCIFGLLIAIFLLVVPRSKTSNIEKRELAKWPTFTFADYFSGDYTAGIMQYYDDTVPARDSFKNAGNNFKSAYGFRSAGGVQMIGAATKVEERETKSSEETTAPAEGSDVQTETTVPETTEDIHSSDFLHNDAEATMSDGILLVNLMGHWRALPLFSGADYTDYVDTVNYVRSALDKKINVYCMPIPLASQYYVPLNYQEYSYDQGKYFDEMLSEMDDGVIKINIVETLNNHNEEDIYLRTDHHWNALGAYYAVRDFAKAANVPFAELGDENYETHVNEGYVGSMYGYTESAELLNDPEDFVWYVPNNNYTADFYDTYFNYNFSNNPFIDTDTANSYLIFLGGDAQIIKITTDVNNGRKLCIIKDSYGNAEMPFFLKSFEEIYYVDARYCDVNLINFINTQGITDVLFSHDAYSLTGDYAYSMSLIANYYTEVPIVDDAPPVDLPGKTTTQETTKGSEEEEESTGEDAEGDGEDETTDEEN